MSRYRLFIVPVLMLILVARAGAEKMPWKALWIGPSAGGTGHQANLWTCYRKSFKLAKRPKSAVARIAADSKYWLWVNGKLAVFEGGLKRGPTPTDTYYDPIDLAPYLTAGRNTIAILHWYWGKDGFSHKSSGKAGLIFEMNAGDTGVRSDRSWKTRPHPAYGTAEGKQPNYRISESPVHFDARNDIGDWKAADFEDSAWQTASELGAPPAGPWNQLRERPIPFWKNSGLKDYTNIAHIPPESTGEPIIAKLPYNAQVTAYLQVESPAGLLIDMETDDPLSGIHSEYVTKEGLQEFEGLAWMNGHAVLYHIPKGVKIHALKYRETGYNTEFTGAFSCDQEFYNRLWIKCQRTLYVTMRDNFMDCPDRERAQWWGDAVNEIGEGFYALSPSSSLLARKAIYNLSEWQRDDRVIFSPVPAGNWDKELPTQMLASIGKYGFWTYYLYTGDARTIKDVYPRVRDYLSVWKEISEGSEQGLIAHRAGGWDWIDWGDNIDVRVLDNAWFCLALEGAANMADLAGFPKEAGAYRAERASIIRAVNAKLWDGAAYRDPQHAGDPDDRANALCVVAGIAPREKYPVIKAVLTKVQGASPYMEKYVLEALVLMGYPEVALDRMKQRYAESVASPLTTLPETFPMGGTNNHAWSGGPLTILSQYVVGIAPLTPAFATYQVKPQMGSFAQIHATVDSIKGPIDVSLRRDFYKISLRMTSPPKSSAIVAVPLDGRGVKRVRVNGKLSWENGTPKAKTPGVVFQDWRSGDAKFLVSPGTWQIEVEFAAVITGH